MTTPSGSVPPPDDEPLNAALLETLKAGALAPTAPGETPPRRRRRRTRLLAGMAAVAALAIGITGVTVASGALRRGSAYAEGDCGVAPLAQAEGPAAVELRLVAPSTVVSGTRIAVQVQARSLDGGPHQLLTGLRPDLDWVRQGRVVGSEDGPHVDMGLIHLVPADGSWSTFTWDAPALTAVQERVGGCTAVVDNAGRRRPLPPGRYDLVAALRVEAGVTGDQDATYVSAPVPVEVLAAR